MAEKVGGLNASNVARAPLNIGACGVKLHQLAELVEIETTPANLGLVHTFYVFEQEIFGHGGSCA